MYKEKTHLGSDFERLVSSHQAVMKQHIVEVAWAEKTAPQNQQAKREKGEGASTTVFRVHQQWPEGFPLGPTS